MSDFKPVIHMIGNAHIDPVWLWQWQEGYAEVKATFRSALDRMKEFPEFVFTCACAAYYRWVEESDPGMFEEIRQRVAEGRWRIVGGWWIQPDCNIPSGESFARHGLLSQRYFLEKFGRTATVGYNVDSFGHNGMLPQILRKSGMDSYVMMRPDMNEMALPANLFWWESPDGSRVAAFRIHINYASWWGDPDPVKWKTDEVLKLAHEQRTDFMNFYGVGNHGGGPTVKNIRAIRELRQELGDNAVLFSSPDAFFQSVRQKEFELPVVRGDLQHHASGCYANHSETKASNRRLEHLMYAAEAFSALAGGLLNAPYPADKLQKAWEKVLFNQFHDIMGGCSIKRAYQDVRDFYGQAGTEAAEAQNLALQRVAWAIDTARGEEFFLSRDKDWSTWEMGERGVPVAVFNPLAWAGEAPVHFHRRLASVTDDQGTALPLQTIRADRINEADKWDTLFMTKVPALGYRVFWAYTERVLDYESSNPACSDTVLENGLVRIEFDPCTAAIKSYLLKGCGVEAAKGPLGLPVVIDEDGVDTWAHGVNFFDREIGRFVGVSTKLIECGPVRSVIRAVSRYGNSTLRQDFMLYAGSEAIEVEAALDWHEPRKMLKLAFDSAVEATQAAYSMPFGHIMRPADGEEEPGHEWVSVSGPGSCGLPCSLSLVSGSKYSYSIQGGRMAMTVVRSPIFAQHKGELDEFCEVMDQGAQEFTYALLAHQGDWRAVGLPRLAMELTNRPVMMPGTYHKGPLPLVYEGIRVSADNVVVTALKRAEDGGGLVLRCYEAFGRTTEAEFELVSPARRWTAEIKPYSIETWYLPDDPAEPVRGVNLVEM